MADPSPQPAPDQRRLPWPLELLALAAIWGTSFLLIKVAIRHVTPVQLSFGRVACGALVLGLLCAARRDRLPSGWRTWGHLAVAALLMNTAPFSLLALGERHVSSVLAGILNATVPLWTLPAALAILPGERADARRLTGLGLGFCGVVVLLAPWSATEAPSLHGAAACLGAAACYGLGFPYTRRFLAGRPESALALSTAQLATAVGQLALVLAVLGQASAPSAPLGPLLGIAVLGACSTGIAYILNYDLIRRVGATSASTVTYLVPLFSTVLGVVALGEPLGLNQPVGGLVVLAGVALTQTALRLPRRGRLARVAPPHAAAAIERSPEGG